MEQPRDKRRVRTQRALLDAAERRFTAVGYANATVEAIAADAGVAISSLYFNFPGGKGELYLALALHAVGVNEEVLEQAHAAGGSPVSRLRAIGDAYLRFHLDHPLALRLVALHDLDERDDPAVVEAAGAIARRLNAMVGRLGSVIDEALAAQGRADPETAEQLAVFLWGAWNGVLSLRARGTIDERRLRRVLAAGQELVLTALDAEPGRGGGTPR